MLTLSLLRHAKSDWGSIDQEDYDRALAPRGIKSAPVMGKALAKHGLKPDLIVCSSAVRTRATLALVLPQLPSPAPEILYDDQLYLAAPSTMLDYAIAEASKRPGVSNVLIIAHNPGLHALALELTGGGDKKAIGELASKFPTAALAVFEFPAKDWREVRAGTGTLLHFMTPRGLE